MRIISGANKRKKIIIPDNLSVRPTTDRAKEALFNIIETRYLLKQKQILDLFSGTGNISYEFASRGCDSIIAIDYNLQCVNFIKELSKELELNINIIHSDCIAFINQNKMRFDIIFADPPYDYSHYHKLKDLILNKGLLKKNGCLILEHDASTLFDDKNMERRKYGNVHFSIFTK